MKKIQISIVDRNVTRVVFNIIVDPVDGVIDRSDRPWVGGRADGLGDTYRTESLDQMLCLIQEELQAEWDGGDADLIAFNHLMAEDIKQGKPITLNTRGQEQLRINAANEEFKGTFGLRPYPFGEFRILPEGTYVSEGKVQIVVQILNNQTWNDFARGSVEELRNQMIPIRK
jgi:hypothetical protein